jgi:hypothetical protein
LLDAEVEGVVEVSGIAIGELVALEEDGTEGDEEQD